MMLNAKIIALVLGLLIGICTFLALFIFIPTLDPGNRIFVSLVASFVSFLCIWVILNLFVFRELEEINELLVMIKKENYNIEKKIYNVNTSNPLILIKKEIIDFAEKKQLEINELKKLETFRREFLADVSHELKTPIFASQGFIHTLIDGAIDDLDVRDKFLGKAATSLESLNVLVEDLLTISQLEIGEIKMQYSHFDLRKLAGIIFEQLEDAAKKRNIRLVLNKYSPRSCYVYADKYRIGQVLTNLIMNAIKYGKENGTVVVSYHIENENVTISVKDNGPGIAPYHLKRIFERFYRVEKSRSRDQGGTGLGLAIVKHILEAHNSKIFAESKPALGTTFTFLLKRGKVINENG